MNYRLPLAGVAIAIVLMASHTVFSETDDPINCEQFPLWDDGTVCLYAADHYDHGTYAECENPGEPTMVYYWGLVTDPVPETCPDCEGNRSSAAAPAAVRLKLTSKVGKNHQPSDTLSGPFKTRSMKEWFPKNVSGRKKGIEVESEQWLKIALDAEHPDVFTYFKLYVWKLDFDAAQLPAATPVNARLRVERVGFETEGIPDGEVAKEIKLSDIGKYKYVTADQSNYAFVYPKVAAGNKPQFVVFTNTQIWEP